ncbi:unnamed protein product [Acanthoscelides obtectus]|uniref:C2H2-type domain-containing protein n=1 Tax=Acanthoscelides obtectus TaxID=200917 RepID=A0A9P0JZP5_ACAOB|nr:unnamed protein product [Acanthoscelides obtectus]CAK1669745.1 hypothetical protein AOBTE_LOCUS27221 [Acanthoscelides obtectus]
MFLSKRDTPKIIGEVTLKKEKKDPEIQRPPIEENPPLVASTSGEKMKLRSSKNDIANERMRRFLKLTTSDLKPPPKKQFKCELPWPNVKKPVDTIRCHKCGVLYQRGILVSHIKVCKGQLPKCKYSCAQCSFSNTSYSELASHVKAEHSKKTK